MSWDSFIEFLWLMAWFGGFLGVVLAPVAIYFLIISAIADKVNHRPRREDPRGFEVKLRDPIV